MLLLPSHVKKGGVNIFFDSPPESRRGDWRSVEDGGRQSWGRCTRGGCFSRVAVVCGNVYIRSDNTYLWLT